MYASTAFALRSNANFLGQKSKNFVEHLRKIKELRIANVVAGDISSLQQEQIDTNQTSNHPSIDYETLLQLHPQLQGCRRWTPSFSANQIICHFPSTSIKEAQDGLPHQSGCNQLSQKDSQEVIPSYDCGGT
jgi:hypothetical protein